MRFFEGGPNIPDQLLERRDQGLVVFLCGAGVSLNAGMPSFFSLTKYVVDYFDPPQGSAIELEFRPWVEDSQSGNSRPKTPLDQIFHLLYQEYGRDEVNTLVADRLRGVRADNTKSFEHRIIAKISSDQEGKPQIVTTNFDILFEPVLGTVDCKIYEPPALPDISLGVPLTGVTYLHGRLQDPTSGKHSYILSSADFGRAYLSEGWATNFVRSLLNSYTVVLVGYQAEDPPVKYLLQGLNHDGLSDRSNLYAFDKGSQEDIEAKWRDRGVTAISCIDYPNLWRSLEAWADRANDPRKWRSNVINLAMNGPRYISAHERGQVAHLVRTTPGARLFSQTDPPPTPEWLCVFDSWCRVAKESKGYGKSKESFDPIENYALDDDPPRPAESFKPSQRVHDHILEWRRGDTNPPTFHRLNGRQIVGYEDMPPRLLHITNWISKNLESPITAWWAVRQNGLHPRLEEAIRFELRRKTVVHSEARRIWDLILEYQADIRNISRGFGWYEIKDRIEKEGWSQSVLRDFEAVTAPILTIERPLGIGYSKPPLGGWDEIDAQDIGRWEVKFPDRHGENLEVSSADLESVFRIAEGHFHRAANLLEDTKTAYFHAPTCYPEREMEGEDRDRHEVFSWFLELFARMILEHPKIARGYAATWPMEEKYFFRKLKLFAFNQIALFDADDAAESVLTLSPECFWDVEIRRELMFLISDRWEDFSPANRKALGERLLNGPNKRDHWSHAEFPAFKDEMACRYTRWLVQQGKTLVEDQEARLEEMISGLPEWKDGWALGLVTEHLGSSGWISTDEKPDAIAHLPISQVVDAAKAEHRRDYDSFTEKRPFTGLVKAYPRKALASLSYSAKCGQYPQEFWSILINDWPEQVNPRLYRVFLHRLGRLPYEVIRKLNYTIGRWLQEKLLLAYEFDKTLAWNTFDHLFSGVISEDGIATTSGIGEVRRGSEIIVRSRRTVDHAINSPVGQAMKGLHRILSSLKLSQGAEIPNQIKSRMEDLISSPGEGSDHAILILAQQVSWLYYLDPQWVKDRLLPCFQFDHDHSEPAWNGFLSVGQNPSEEVGAIIKPLLGELFPVLYKWNWDESFARVATQIMIELAVFRSDKPDGFNAKEMRHCLRSMNDRNRQNAVSRLAQIGQRKDDGWSQHVIPFINTVWPRERAFRTSSLVSSWVSLLEDTGDSFPDVLCAVRRYLVPLTSDNHWLYQFSREFGGREPLTVKFPSSVLELLDAVVSNSAEEIPYELAQALDLIEENDPRLVSDRRFMRLIDLIEQT